MPKRFFKNLMRSFCVYLLAALNLVNAIRTQSYDWLLWLSVVLVVLSIVLDFLSARKETADGQA